MFMIDLLAVGLEKRCSQCGYRCDISESYCQACGENLKQRPSNYR